MEFPTPHLCSFVTAVFCSVLAMFAKTWGSIERGLMLSIVLLYSLCQIRTQYWYWLIAFISFASLSVPGAVFCFTALLYLLIFFLFFSLNTVLSFWEITFHIKEDLEKSTLSSQFSVTCKVKMPLQSCIIPDPIITAQLIIYFFRCSVSFPSTSTQSFKDYLTLLRSQT